METNGKIKTLASKYEKYKDIFDITIVNNTVFLKLKASTLLINIHNTKAKIIN